MHKIGTLPVRERRRHERTSSEIMSQLIGTRTESWAAVSEAIALLISEDAALEGEHILELLRTSVDAHLCGAALNRVYILALQEELSRIR